ncbi:hypothetical protein [Pectobacterium phage PEAT2]|uniref:Uncharacterized protein n=1 Tax=Pectobacterium phage PEAT2 TaxID=2053078 RepID=A0A2H4N7F5_9CAUD|nr:hypothetical protein F8206_gp20 [Pectobacterium phage PEAT2]ATV25116.1 hypothetical protein [Pectobacterium phage PEAT2]
METLSYCQLMERMLAAEARMVELAAENVALKNAITDHSQSVHFCEVCGKDDPCSTDDVCYALRETPATDRIYAGIKADEAKFIFHSILDNPAVTDLGSLVDWLEQHANDGAAAVQTMRERAK